MVTEITISQFEVKEIIKKHLQSKGYKLEEGYSQRDSSNYSIVLCSDSIKVKIFQ